MKHIILFLVISSFISKTRAQPNAANFVYRIVITGKEQGKSSIQTGFSVKGQDGIYTALHGIAKKISSDGEIKIRAIRYFPGTSTKRDSIMDLAINKIDVERDLVLLKAKYPIESGLLEISFDLKPISWNTRLNLHGFPETRFLKSNTIEVQNPPLMVLSALLEGDTNFEKFAKRNSPSLKVTVIQFDAEHIFPGHSGSPVIFMNSKIVGVANGTRNNRMNQSISTWAIPFTEIKLKEYKSNDRAILAKLAEIKTLYASDEIMEEEVMPDSTAFYKAVQSSKKYPTFIFGLRWSRPAHFQSDGVLISTHLNDLNANLDISLDKQVYKFFYLGCYISSKYLQYKVLNKFNYDLPLLSDTYVVNHQKWLDTYGFQVSIIPFRGVLWQTSLGLGGFYAGNGGRLNNHRAYATYTHYLFHSQHLALQAKGLYFVQNEQILISTLGNARFSVQSLKQYFLCFGISYSFQKRK